MPVLDQSVESDLVNEAERSLQALKNLVAAIGMQDIVYVMYCASHYRFRCHWFDEAWQHVLDERLAQSRKGDQPIE